MSDEIATLIWQHRAAFARGLLGTARLVFAVWFLGLLFGVPIGAMAARRDTLGRCLRLFMVLAGACPAIVLLFWMHYPMQSLLGVILDPYVTSVLALALLCAFATGEVIARAISNVPREFLVVAELTGLSRLRIIIDIELPLIARQALPGVITVQMFMLHATIFASLISYEEIFRVVQNINSMQYRPVLLYTSVAVFFLFVSVPFRLAAAYCREKFTLDISDL